MWRRIYSLLRSRKLAFWLIAAFTAYAVIATIITEADYERAYSNPVFLALAFALALATGACAWERTRGAVRAWCTGTTATPGFIERLERSPQIRVELAGDADAATVQTAVASRLRGMGLRVRSGPGRVIGSTTRMSLLGSPVFHWALVALFVLIVAGRLTRSEGLMGVPLGSARVDRLESYGSLSRGILRGDRLTGLTVRVPALDLNYVVDGVERGAAPQVELYRGDKLVASRLVYPNSPLRYGSMMIHPSAYGLAARYTLRGVEQTQTVEVLYDFSEKVPEARNSAPIGLDRGGEEVQLVSSIPLDRKGRTAPWVLPADPRVEWAVEEPGGDTTGTVRPGEAINLGGGASLVLENVTYYARISVVDDWSVYPIYATLVLGMLGLGLALLLPPKTAWVMLVETDRQRALHVRTQQSRADRIFAPAVEAAVRESAEGEDDRR